ncbi:MAG: tripartite tricarboxylate transporter substrate binding protein [Burkholderiaceae bacterium]|jgi:tripartite-type tricarboxylate transporter receptor subunit TctC|nr:tripartite tricarboxylate transporter substrate binding protein [Burkholderiaceae bacterium]
MKRRSFLLTTAASVSSLAAYSPLWAQENSPISIIVPVNAGSGGDASTRVLANILSRQLQRPVLVENKPGADAMIATRYVLNGPTDGTRILLTSPTNMVIVPLVDKKTDFNPETQLQPIITSARGGTALVVKADAYKSLAEFVADAKARPGIVSLGTYGGHYYKLLALMMQQELGIKLNTVAYKDPTPAMSDVVGGNINAMLGDSGGARPFFEAGKTHILALTNEQRPAVLSSVPTFQELGYPGLTAYIWVGFAVKAGTSPEIVNRLFQLFSAGLKSKEYLDYMEKSSGGTEVVGFDPEKTRLYAQEERKRFKALIEKTGYSIN